MGHLISRNKATLFALALLVATPANAQVPELTPFNYQLKYDVSWNSIPIGRVRIAASETEFRYSVSIDTKTRGIVRLFDNTRSIIKTTGRVNEAYLPQRYESKSIDDDSTKTTTVTYDTDGIIKTRKRVPADDPASRPPVPIEQANEGVDPLTAMLRVRHLLRDNIARNVRETSVRTYDGARLADFNFMVASRATLQVMGESRNAINIVLTRKPIAGYKQKELKKYNEGDPNIYVYFSADEQFLPLAADIKLGFGTISAKLSDVVIGK